MELGIVWLGVIVGLLGFIGAGFLAGYRGGAGDSEKRMGRLSAGLIAALSIIFWAVSMQKNAPFSTGQTLGFGFLIGGLSGTIARLIWTQMPGSIDLSERQMRLSLIATAFLSVFSISTTYLLFRSDPQWALVGCAIGIAMSAIISGLTSSQDSTVFAHSEVWAGFGITLAAGTVLAVRHFDTIVLRIWWPLPILLAVSALAASFVGAEVGFPGLARGKRSAAISVLVSAVLVTGLSAIYSWRILRSWQLLAVVAAAVLVGLLILLISSVVREDRSSRMNASALSVLLVVAFIVAAFKVWAGFGIALGLLGAWAVAFPVLGSVSREDNLVAKGISGALIIGLIVLLFRLFVTVYEQQLRITDLQIHYTFIGALLGMMIPVFAISALEKLDDAPPVRRLAGVALIGLLAAGSPLLLYLIWEIKAVLGLVFGLAAGSAFMLFLRSAREENCVVSTDYSAALLVIGAELTAIQFVSPLTELELTRSSRIWVVMVVLALTVIWSAVSGVLAYRKSGGR